MRLLVRWSRPAEEERTKGWAPGNLLSEESERVVRGGEV